MHRKWLFNFYSPSNLKFSMNSNIKWHPNTIYLPKHPKSQKMQKGTKNTKNDFWGKGILRKNANYTQKNYFLVN